MIPLDKIFKADKIMLDSVQELIGYYGKNFNIDSELRQQHFFAQIREEVGVGLNIARAENLNYTCAALVQLFAYFKRNPKEARKFGRCDNHRADQEAIANRVYANRLGNGDVYSGDGWRTRGRGVIQLTGVHNYNRISKVIFERTGIVVDLYKDPDLLLTTTIGVLSAMAFWYDNKLWELADNGASDSTVNSVTKKVNYYTHSYKERVKHFRDIQALA